MEALLDVFDRLVAEGHTVVFIEHAMELVACADWVIDVGPEGGAAAVRSSLRARRRTWPRPDAYGSSALAMEGRAQLVGTAKVRAPRVKKLIPRDETREHADHDQHQREPIHISHAPQLGVASPAQSRGGGDADEGDGERERLVCGVECGLDHQRTEQSKEHRAMAHQDGEIRLVHLDAVERVQARLAEHAAERKQGMMPTRMSVTETS